MKNKRTVYHICLLVIGLTLIGLAVLGKVDAFWNGMGSALAVMGVIRLLRDFRLNRNEAYREAAEIAANDERNRFLRGKAWAWAGYLFILITAFAVIGFKLAGNDLLCQAAGCAVCLLMLLYWGSYLVLQKKY